MLHGIDISNWQCGIDLEDIIRNSDIQFVICKASGGDSFIDYYCKNWLNIARENGLYIGTYHYANDYNHFNEPEKEAEHYFNTIGDIDNCNVCLDIETDVSCPWNEFSDRFCARYKELSGLQPMIYTSASQTYRFENSSVSHDSCLWVAGYPYAATNWTNQYMPYDISPWLSCSIWQFTSSLELCENTFDGNIGYFQTEKDWLNLCKNTSHDSKKITDNLIIDIFKGKYGNGYERKYKLEKEGYNYEKVQKRVNEVFDMACDTINGYYGNDDIRKQNLGKNYYVVQNVVNILLGVM